MNTRYRIAAISLLACVLVLVAPVAFAQKAQDEQEVPTEDVPPAEQGIPSDDVPADAPAAAEAAPERDPTAANPAPAFPELRPVFEQFGGEAGLVALMDDFMVQLLADPRTKSFFENVNQAAVKQHLVEQFCVILGGPCTYTGRDMKTAHEGFNIDRRQFNALVEDLQIAMDKRGIPFRAQNQLLSKLAPMHREIEGR